MNKHTVIDLGVIAAGPDEFDILPEIEDIGDATIETKQVSPVPPHYFDSTFGFGIKPN